MKSIYLSLNRVFLVTLVMLFSVPNLAFSQTEISGGAISANTVWTEAESPFILQGNLTINEHTTLTIEEDVVVRFAGNFSITVYGTLEAEGVSFLSHTSPDRGSWGSIRIASRSGVTGTVELVNSQVQHGGSAAIQVDNGDLILDGTEISNSVLGIRIGVNAGSVSLNNVTLSGNQWPIVDGSLAALTTDGIQTMTGNDHDGVSITRTTLPAGTYRMPFIPVPYAFQNSLTVQQEASLSIDAENIIKFENNRGITVHGTLVADGSGGSSPIVFTSYRDDNFGGDTNNDGTATAAFSRNWAGIEFSPTAASESLLDNTEFHFTGSNQRGSVTVNSSAPVIRNSFFRNSYIGVYLTGTAAPEITGSNFGTSELYPIAMELSANPVFDDNVLSFMNNQYDAIGIVGGTLPADADLIKRDFTGIPNITYVMLSDVLVPEGVTLTIEEGVVLKAWSSRIVVKGTLTAQGTAAEKIIFTSVRDDNDGNPNDTNKDGNNTVPAVGDWRGIIFDTGSDDSVLEHVSIRYARGNQSYNFGGVLGWYTPHAAITIADADIAILHSEVRNSDIGITVLRDGKPVLQHNSFVNSQSVPLALSLSADPSITDNDFLNAGYQAIGLVSETVSRSGVVRRLDFGGHENITYVMLGSITISSGTRIDIEPGVVIKSDDWRTDLYVEGALYAEGTEAQPIIMTSIYDDTVGNPEDTNRDGGAKAPEPRDWGALAFRPSADTENSLLKHMEVRFGTHGIVLRGASVTVEQVVVRNARYWGIIIDEEAEPVIRHTHIANCGSDPILLSPRANPTFEAITFNANETSGIGIREGQGMTYWSDNRNYGARYVALTNTLTGSSHLHVWSMADFENVPYVIRNDMHVGVDSRLEIDPGVIIKFHNSTSARIVVGGAMIAEGTPDERIYFTSLRDDSKGGDTNNDGAITSPAPGDWGSIEFVASAISDENVMKHVTVRYARGHSSFYPVTINNTFVHMENVMLELLGESAIGILGGANPVIKDSEFLNISGAPIIMDMFANPVFSGNVMANVSYRAIQIRGESWTNSGTIPYRDFAGYENITYMLRGHITIGAGVTITIPEGIVFKTLHWVSHSWHSYEFRVNGALVVEGTAENPVVFTHVADDDYGNPPDTQNDGHQTPDQIGGLRDHWIVFNSSSDDAACRIEHAVFRYRKYHSHDSAIRTNNASPTIRDSRFEYNRYGIFMTGVSNPVVEDNVFHDQEFTPLLFSLVSFPGSASGNVLTGRTFRALGVMSETLVQDVTLPAREFAGIEGIPYYISGNYTVGTGAILTIDPGVMLKFERNTSLLVERGLIAEGEAEQPIVFTSIFDDFYGGDTNSDEDATSPVNPVWNQWYGITFANTSLAPFSQLDHVVVRYAGQNSTTRAAITTMSASPTITNSVVSHNSIGLWARGASNPVINESDIYGNSHFGVKNEDKAFNLDATNNWWGSDTGPTHAGNPGGVGNVVSDAVMYIPFNGGGTLIPMLGDVSLNGRIQAFDAALILRDLVGLESLTPLQKIVADVSGNGSVSPMDASYILQYVVKMIHYFPADARMKGLPVSIPASQDALELIVEGPELLDEGRFAMDIRVDQAHDLYGLMIRFDLEGSNAVLSEYHSKLGSDDYLVAANQDDGKVALALAGLQSVPQSATVVRLTFEGDAAGFAMNTSKLIANEEDLTHRLVSGEAVPDLLEVFALHQNYPNPFNPGTVIRFDLPEASDVRMEVYNTIGQRVAILANGRYEAGSHTVLFDATTLSSGVYVYRIQAGTFVKSQQMTLIR